MGACRAKISVSGKRDSDPRPQPWQGCALPTELFPPKILLKNKRSISLNAVAKVTYFSESPNFFSKKNRNNKHIIIFLAKKR